MAGTAADHGTPTAGGQQAADTAALEELAAELSARGYRTRLNPAGTQPLSLTVTNPGAAMLTETVLAHAGWFWWPWADRIAPTANMTAAAGRIARVLATAGSPA